MTLHSRRWRAALLRATILTCALAGLAPAHAASFSFTYLDGANEGFNDQAPYAPTGGNNATTLGQARRNAFEYAAGLAGAALTSAVTIRVQASMDSLGGSANSAVLGSAGPWSAYRDFSGAPVANTWYAVALANKLAGIDLDTPHADIEAQFNSDVDNGAVLGATNWYYGLDGNPGGHIDFVSVVLHELVHGLGFSSFVDDATGAKALGFDDAYMRNLERHGASPSSYPAMTDAQRAAANKAAPDLHWIGAAAVAAAGSHVEMYAPNPLDPGSSVSHFSTSLSPNQLMEPFYTGAIHSLGLAAQLLSDMGWGAGSSPPPPPPAQYTLSVGKSGSGTVTSAQPGINCGFDCSETYGAGTSVTLHAAADPGSSFAGWSGDCAGSGSCNLTMTAARSVTATFNTAAATYSLSVSRNGNGAGTVTSSPGGISCGANCSASYSAGTVVTLSAAPAAGSSFAGWSGGGCSGTGSCIVNLGADTAVTATFTAPTAVSQWLNVAKNGPGLVLSGDLAILCGPLCAASYNAGAAVALTAVPEVGYAFTGWSGGCTGAAASCNATINAATTVTANFAAAGDAGGPRVTATANGQSSGSVASPVIVRYTVRQCAELFVIVNAPTMGINWAYVNSSGFAVPMPGNLAAVTPHKTNPADGSYTLYSGAAPAGSYELYLSCDNVSNGGFNFSAAGLNGVFTRLGVTVP